MTARITVFALLVLGLATYASTPAANTTTQAHNTVVCCDGDPGTPIGH